MQCVSSCPFFLLLLSQPGPAVASAQKCPPAAAPNAKNVKQMLLDWCRAKTEPYEVNMPRLSLNYGPVELYMCIALHLIAHSLPLFLSNCYETGGGHPELLLKLERWHSLLRLGAPLLP